MGRGKHIYKLHTVSPFIADNNKVTSVLDYIFFMKALILSF